MSSPNWLPPRCWTSAAQLGKGTDSRSMATAAVVRQWVISRIWERSASTPQLWVNEPDEARRGASLADVNFQPTHGGAITS